jgi:hypothetical protein
MMEKFENCNLYVVVEKDTNLPLFSDWLFDNIRDAFDHISALDSENMDKWEPRILEKRWLKDFSFLFYP